MADVIEKEAIEAAIETEEVVEEVVREIKEEAKKVVEETKAAVEEVKKDKTVKIEFNPRLAAKYILTGLLGGAVGALGQTAYSKHREKRAMETSYTNTNIENPIESVEPDAQDVTYEDVTYDEF